MQESSKKTVYNVGAGIVGALLAALALFGLVQQQSSGSKPANYSSTVTYDQ